MVPNRRRFKTRLESVKAHLLKYAWVQLFIHVANEMAINDAGDMAASLAYYSLLSLFPLLLGVISVLGLFLPSATVQERLLSFFERSNLPGLINLVEQNINQVIRLRGALGVLSLLGLLWSGSAVFSVINRAVNRAWNIRNYQPFYVRKFWDLILALGTSALFLVSVGLSGFTTLLPRIGFPLTGTPTVLGSHFLAFLLVLLIFLLIYKYLPHTRVAWCNIWLGAVLTAVLFEMARGFVFYFLGRFINYELVYGSLASVIIFLVWIYYSAFVFILGAEFTSEYTKMREGNFTNPAAKA